MADPTLTGVPAEMLERYRRLQALKLETEHEIAALERGLRVAGVLSRRGRPSVEPTHTAEQAREAHRRWTAGERGAWVASGERQYKRERRRAARLREDS